MKPNKTSGKVASKSLELDAAMNYLDDTLRHGPGVVPQEFHSYTATFLQVLAKHFCCAVVRFPRLYLDRLVDYVLSNPASDDVDSFPADTRELLRSQVDDVDVVAVLEAVHCLVEGTNFEDDLPFYTREEETALRFGVKARDSQTDLSPEQKIATLESDLDTVVRSLQALTQYCLDTNILTADPAPSSTEVATWSFKDSHFSRPYLGLAMNDAAQVEPQKGPHTVLSVMPWPGVSSVKIDLSMPTERLVQLVSRTFCDVHQTIELKKGA